MPEGSNNSNSRTPISYDEAFVRERSMQRVQETPRYIAVEGPIGAGKSTLTELLAERFSAHMLFERFEENPFLQGFYADRARLAFQTQIFFLLSRYRQQQELLQTDLFFNSMVSDYMFAKDRIFATLNLSKEELGLYDQIERALGKTIPLPDVVIYLQSSVAKLEENIRHRGRPYEKNLQREYLEELVRAYNDYFFHYRESRLIVVDMSSFDFVNKPDHLEELVRTITRSPHPPVEYITISKDQQAFELQG